MRELEGVENFKNFPGEHPFQTPLEACALVDALLWSPSVCILDPRPELAQVLYEKWGHLILFPSSFETIMNCFDEWTNGSDRQRRIINPSRSPHRHITRRQHLLPKREGTSENSLHFASGKHEGGKVIFLYSEDPYLASQRNDRGTTLRFGRHRRPCMQMQLPSIEAWFVRNLWPCTLDQIRRLCFWPTRLVGYFFALYFFYFVAFQEFTMLQSPNRHVLRQTWDNLK